MYSPAQSDFQIVVVVLPKMMLQSLCFLYIGLTAIKGDPHAGQRLSS